MDKSKIDKLTELATPVTDFLKENYHPYYTVVINSEGVRLVETLAYAPAKESAHCGE